MTFPGSLTLHPDIVDGVDYMTAAYFNPLKDDINALQRGALADFNNVVVVGKETNYQTVQAGINAAAAQGPSASRPMTVYLLPGIYNEAGIQIYPYISLAGLARELCIIRPTVTATRVIGVNESSMSNLTIDRSGLVLGEMAIRCEGSCSLMGIDVIGGGAGASARDAEIYINCDDPSEVNLNDVTVKNPGTSQLGTGIVSAVKAFMGGDGGKITFSRVKIWADSYPIQTNGIDIVDYGDVVNAAIRSSVILAGNTSTRYPIAFTSDKGGALVLFSYNNSFRYQIQTSGIPGDVTVIENNNFVNPAQVI